nr:hypothetical protein BaRGS_009402 [Batillaria attramentaria]
MVVEQGGFVPWDNPDNIISKEVEYRFDIFHSLGFIPLLFLVGAPANILSAAVFCRQGLKDRINLCLFSLSLADLLTITVTFLLTAETAYNTLTDGNAYFFITYFPGLTGFTFVSQFLSVVIASERCFCVASPFKAKKVLSTCTMAIIILVGSAVLLAGMLAIAGPKHTMACVYDPATNVTGNIVYVTKYYLHNKRILDIVDVFVYATAFPALFLVVIIITTAVTTAKLRSAITFRQRSTLTPATATAPSDVKPAPSRKEVALTKMLVATSVLFIVCLTPNVAVQMTSFFVPDLGFNRRYHNLNIVLWSVISEFRVINSSRQHHYVGIEKVVNSDFTNVVEKKPFPKAILSTRQACTKFRECNYDMSYCDSFWKTSSYDGLPYCVCRKTIVEDMDSINCPSAADDEGECTIPVRDLIDFEAFAPCYCRYQIPRIYPVFYPTSRQTISWVVRAVFTTAPAKNYKECPC